MTFDSKTLNLFVFPDGRMDRKNAAQYLGCAPKTLADWATKGSGPEYLQVGGRVFYFKAALDAWIGAQAASASSCRQRQSSQR